MEIPTNKDAEQTDEIIADLKSRLNVSEENEAKLKRAYTEMLNSSGDEKELAQEAVFEIVAQIKKETQENPENL